MANHWLKGATVIGTIWVDRKTKTADATRAAVPGKPSEGTTVILFPEGTTHLGPDTCSNIGPACFTPVLKKDSLSFQSR